MIINGKNGSICIYWKDLLVSSLPRGKMDYDDYLNEANKFILLSMKEGKNIKELIHWFHQLCRIVYEKKIKKKKISSEYHGLFHYCIFSLIKLNLIDKDDVLLICPRKKPKKLTNTPKTI